MSENDDKKAIEFFSEQYDSTIKLKENVLRDFMELKISVIKSKREFYQNLIILLGAIIGLASFWGYEKINKISFIIGVVTYIIFVLFAVLYFREVLDKDLNGLQSMDDKFSIVIGKKQKLVEDYIKGGIFTKEKVLEFLGSLKSDPAIAKLEEDNKKLVDERDKRMEKRLPLDFTGEIFVFLFFISATFLTLSLTVKNIDWQAIPLIIIILIIVSFNNTADLFIKNINKFINYVRGFLKN
jgi:hypothetical protein